MPKNEVVFEQDNLSADLYRSILPTASTRHSTTRFVTESGRLSIGNIAAAGSAFTVRVLSIASKAKSISPSSLRYCQLHFLVDGGSIFPNRAAMSGSGDTALDSDSLMACRSSAGGASLERQEVGHSGASRSLTAASNKPRRGTFVRTKLGIMP